jgi:hypothetical protein
MMEASGIVDGFEQAIRQSVKNVSAHFDELERALEDENDMVRDVASSHLERQSKKIKEDCMELYVGEMVSRKEDILKDIALIYDKYLDETRIDAFYELYSGDTRKEIMKFQPIIMQDQLNAFSQYEISAMKKVLELAVPRDIELKAKHLAKIAFGRAVENGASFDKALTVYSRKYWQIIKIE